MLSHGNMYRFSFMSILISSLCPNVVLTYTIVHVKLDDAIIKDCSPPIFKISTISNISYNKPNCKNLMFDAVFFLLNAQIFLIALVPLTKICSLSVSPARSEQASHVVVIIFLYRCHLHICNQKNGDFFSAKIE